MTEGRARVFERPWHVSMFAKAPVAGRVKTRLTPPLEPAEAAALHAAFLRDLGGMLDGLCRGDERIGASLARAGDASHPVFEALLEQAALEPIEQRGEGLGERMKALTEEAFEAGIERLVIIGSDSPTMPARLIEQAFALLDEHDVVLGPSFDGGYYLIALGGAHVAVFDEIAWSTAEVLRETLTRCREAGLSVALLEFWYDVDDIEDLRLLRAHVLEHLAWGASADYSDTSKILTELVVRGHLD